MMDFSKALQLLKDGVYVYRKGWNGKNMHLMLIDSSCFDHVDLEGAFLQDFIAIKYLECGKTYPWLASQGDLLATDWVIKEIEED